MILIGIAIPATATLLDLEDAKTNADITLQVTGIQWKWKYTFVDEDVSFISSLAQSSRDVIKEPTGNENYLLEVDNELVLPVGKKIRFLFHSNDVIHAWWVPALAVKQDPYPGLSTTPGPLSKSRVFIVGNAPNFVARIMASCRSWSMRLASRSTRNGSPA